MLTTRRNRYRTAYRFKDSLGGKLLCHPIREGMLINPNQKERASDVTSIIPSPLSGRRNCALTFQKFLLTAPTSNERKDNEL